jgi:opacity protein-like surface antigen
MKKVILAATAIAATMGMAQAYAQAQNFEGFSAGVNAQLDTSKSSRSDGSSDSGTSTTLGLQGRYDWAFGNKFVLGLGASYDPGVHAAGSYATGAAANTSKRLSVELTPGYALTDKTLVYGKVSQNYASVGTDDGSTSAFTQGVGYGLGVRSYVAKQVYVQAGYDTYRYNDTSLNNGTVGLKGNALSLGVGYKF